MQWRVRAPCEPWSCTHPTKRATTTNTRKIDVALPGPFPGSSHGIHLPFAPRLYATSHELQRTPTCPGAHTFGVVALPSRHTPGAHCRASHRTSLLVSADADGDGGVQSTHAPCHACGVAVMREHDAQFGQLKQRELPLGAYSPSLQFVQTAPLKA
jgi:hypothetical protein